MKVCPTCHRPMNTYVSRLNKSLCLFLLKVSNYAGTGTFSKRQLLENGVISISDYTNVSHLKNLGLLHPVDDGVWELTPSAVSLLAGGSVVEWVKIFSKRVIERATTFITLSQAIGYYEPPKEWAKRAETLRMDRQGELFG